MITAILDHVFRREGGRVLAGLIRFTGDFELDVNTTGDRLTESLGRGDYQRRSRPMPQRMPRLVAS